MRPFDLLIGELESAVAEGTQGKRVEILRRVTDLFLDRPDQFSSQQVGLFGDVMTILIKKVETNVLAELGGKLAPVEQAPYSVVRNLARHDEIAVAGPVLTRSILLTEQDLIEIAQTKSQAHLGAISDRSRVSMAVSDVLVERGNTDVLRRLSRNAGASFSERGFASMANRGAQDEQIATNLGARVDVPPQILQDLMAKATETVRQRLAAAMPPNSQAAIEKTFAAVANQVMIETAVIRDFRKAEALVSAMEQAKQLTEDTIVEFAKAGRYEEIVAGIARLNSAPVDLIDSLMQSPRYEGVLVACKAGGLHWPTLTAILMNRFNQYRPSQSELDTARSDFIKLSTVTAQRMLRFWLVRGSTKLRA